MGYKGWVSLIPVYNNFCLIEALYGNGWLMFVPLAVGIIGGFLISLISSAIDNFQDRIVFYIVCMVLLFVFILVILVKFIFDFVHSFGKSGWWTVGAFFFLPIIVIVFGISDFLFKETEYPNRIDNEYYNYDAIDGFIYFFRNQLPGNRNINPVRRCKECGAVMRDNTLFCSKCGTRND